MLAYDLSSDVSSPTDLRRGPTPLPPLPASVSTIALWQSEQGISGSPLQTWADAVNGRTLTQATAARRPLVTADGSHFNGRPVVQCNVADQRWMYTGPLGSPLWAAGSRPWVFTVMRVRTNLGAGQYRIWQTGGDGGGGSFDMAFVGNGGDSVAQFGQNNIGGVGVFATVARVPHLFSGGYDGATTKYALDVDGVNQGVSSGVTVTAAQCNMIALGCYYGPAQFNDVSVAMLWFLSARPNALEEAAILAWSRAYYGTP